MTVTLYGIRNCDTMKRARAWLDTAAITHAFHDYKRAGIDRESLSRWCDALGWEMVLNRAGTTFRALPETQKQALDRDRAIDLMLEQPSMIKRPVLEGEGMLMAGFKPDLYASAFGAARFGR